MPRELTLTIDCDADVVSCEPIGPNDYRVTIRTTLLLPNASAPIVSTDEHLIHLVPDDGESPRMMIPGDVLSQD